MNRLDELTERGREARFAGRVDEAALYYEEAYKLAIQLKLEDETIAIGLNLINNLVYLFNNQKALNFIIEILKLNTEFKSKEYYIWLKLRYFSVLYRTKPSYDRLLNLLKDVENVAKENNNLIISAVFVHYSLFFNRTGQFEKSILYSEMAWSNYSSNYIEIVKYSICVEALFSNLKIGNLKAAERWLSLFNDIDSGVHAQKVEELNAKINLILYKERAPREVFILISQLEDAISGVKSVFQISITKQILVRVYLLKVSLEDPYHSLHPAKSILLDKLTYVYMNLSVEGIYERNLLRIDYRLACLRYILNIKPVDDYWYQFKQDLSKGMKIENPEEINLRIRKVNEAIRYGRIHAEDLDIRLSCTIRTDEINLRQERLNEIVEKINSFLK